MWILVYVLYLPVQVSTSAPVHHAPTVQRVMLTITATGARVNLDTQGPTAKQVGHMSI